MAPMTIDIVIQAYTCQMGDDDDVPYDILDC